MKKHIAIQVEEIEDDYTIDYSINIRDITLEQASLMLARLEIIKMQLLEAIDSIQPDIEVIRDEDEE